MTSAAALAQLWGVQFNSIQDCLSIRPLRDSNQPNVEYQSDQSVGYTKCSSREVSDVQPFLVYSNCKHSQ